MFVGNCSAFSARTKLNLNRFPYETIDNVDWCPWLRHMTRIRTTNTFWGSLGYKTHNNTKCTSATEAWPKQLGQGRLVEAMAPSMP